MDKNDIGWCPKRISQQVFRNIDIVKGGRILRIRANYHEKYYTAKVIFGYGDGTTLVGSGLGESTRFIDIAEEMTA
jgi:hypothetical protein